MDATKRTAAEYAADYEGASYRQAARSGLLWLLAKAPVVEGSGAQDRQHLIEDMVAAIDWMVDPSVERRQMRNSTVIVFQEVLFLIDAAKLANNEIRVLLDVHHRERLIRSKYRATDLDTYSLKTRELLVELERAIS